jgi:hypothetical protein
VYRWQSRWNGDLHIGVQRLLVLDFFRRLCRRGGVAEGCLERPAEVCRSLHNSLQTYIFVGLPLGFCVVVSDELGDGISAESLGRLAFLVRQRAAGDFTAAAAGSAGSSVAGFAAIEPGFVDLSAAMGVVFGGYWNTGAAGDSGVSGLSVYGRELMLRLQMTLVMAAAFTIAWTMLMKWLLEARRNLALRTGRGAASGCSGGSRRTPSNRGLLPARFRP